MAYNKDQYEKHKANRIANSMRNGALYIARNQKFVLEYLLVHPCVDCSEADPVVLDFDHVSGDKVAPIGLMIRRGYSIATIEAEIAKCVIRCANCHRRKTGIERSWFRSKV